MFDTLDITSNEQFQRRFKYINLMWLMVSLIYTGCFVFAILNYDPVYLHDWRGFAIIGLAVMIVVFYALRVLTYTNQWPPRLRYSLPLWSGTFLSVVLLSLIDNSFSWLFYIAFGLSFSLFSSRRLVMAIAISTITMFAFQGLLSPPITLINAMAIVGQGVSIVAMTVISMMSQHLIGERFERNKLLQRLTQANAQLELASQRLAESAAQEQELAVLRERTRLARDMHDTLGHALVLISVKLEVAQRLRIIDAERCDAELEATKEVVRESMKELRASIANLRSPALERESASRAISRYAREMAQRTGLHISYDLHEGIEALPEQVEETLWKVGQEALTNVEKHAQAHKVVLHISRRDNYICMSIQDDGIGLSDELLQLNEDGRTDYTGPEGHYGLSGMRERIERIGGCIAFHADMVNENDEQKKRGTKIEVELPLIEMV